MNQKHFEISLDIISRLLDISKSTVHRYCQDHNIRQGVTSSLKKFRINISDSRQIASHWLHKKFEVSLDKKQCFYNFKGGTGKTSICFQVANILAICGLKILVIDADPQGHLSTSFEVDNTQSYNTLYDLIVSQIPFSEIKLNIFEGLDLIPANLSLTKMELALNNMPKREERINIALEKIQNDYDYIIFDTNPSISLLNRNIITFCNTINVVTETQPYSLNGLKILLEDIDLFFNQMQLAPPQINIIPNKYEDRSSTAGEAISALNTLYKEYVIPDFAIRKSEDINMAAKLSLALPFFCKNNSIALEDLIDFIHLVYLKKRSKGEEE